MKQYTFPAGEETKTKLAPAIAYARQFILANGTRTLNLDQLASDLHIAKKTLYKEFPTKEIFIEYVLFDIYHELFTESRAVQLDPKDPLRCFYELMNVLFRHFSRLNSRTVLDVKLFFPRVWKEVKEFEQEIINRILDSFQKADDLNLLRKKFDLKFTADFIYKMLENTFQPEILINAPYSIADMIKLIVDIIMNGIMDKQFTFNFSDDE
ncbi:MAG: TetR/AcrR family transcriptional regulator [Candidatus Marinimicrobia bacterium]|jgi:AcrR family transcriptional regulator|nr:TetR/AcrR family transcriptional regulator [Candidatus Neomarinimicrobiota bacterium]MCK9559859.1 TetR/AcrR family transcriptional regulator [Candidatus Neomarinimicrobiota bacterium]